MHGNLPAIKTPVFDAMVALIRAQRHMSQATDLSPFGGRIELKT
jgi:hypothetical protein